MDFLVTFLFPFGTLLVQGVGLFVEKAIGQHLGTGDYGHLVIDHSVMLHRHFM